ncbi:hypothetical protein FXO38_15500 [Capsicum annuum]|nr:hypothetical protein FXO38_15500 [Capsicum annuum]
MLEVKGSSSSEILICAHDTSLSFTPREFAIITGLSCVSNRSLNNRLKAEGKFYLIQGMPLDIQVWLYECCSNVPPKIALKVDNQILRLLNWKTIAPRPRYEFLMNAMFKDNGKKDVTKDERSVDSDDDFQNPPPKNINECSKKKQKVDSSTPVVKKPSGKKQVNIVDEHTQTRTPPLRAAEMKTPVFKPIPKRQASSSKIKKGKQMARVIFPQVQSKADSHVEEVVVSKRESQVEKETFISKKVFDAFHEEVRQEFKGVREEFTRIRQLVKKKFKKMVKAIEQTKNKKNVGSSSKPDMHGEVDLDTEEQIMITPKIQKLTTDEQRDEIVWPDPQDTIPDDLLPSLNVYSSKSIIVHPYANRELHTPIPKLKIRRPSKFNDSSYTIKFGSTADKYN